MGILRTRAESVCSLKSATYSLRSIHASARLGRTYSGNEQNPKNPDYLELKKSKRRHRQSDDALDDETASESGISVLSAFPYYNRQLRSNLSAQEPKRHPRQQTDSALRRGCRWICKRGSPGWACAAALMLSIFVKWSVSLGSYSGYDKPPMRGDFEAQRHWIALTSSWLNSTVLYHTSSTIAVGPQNWYYHDLSYWGLDYPPVTAYHSLFLGGLARLTASTASFVTLRPLSTASQAELQAWEDEMHVQESEGDMKTWMRATVLGSDLFLYSSAVFAYCYASYDCHSGARKYQSIAVTALTILLQPSLILIDHGHFQYNCVMIGLTIWAVNFLQSGHDLLGALAFVLSLGFKQMALYYSPAIFAHLLGKCMFLGGRKGFIHLLSIGTVTLLAFFFISIPFLFPSNVVLQVLYRIFPFARGLFEDKVANAWCVLNLVVKLRDVASVSTLAKSAFIATFLAILPVVLWIIWISFDIGQKIRFSEQVRSRETVLRNEKGRQERNDDQPPSLVLLPHALFLSSMAFFLFSFQVHEKSILLPLMPITLLMSGREAGHGTVDWEWGVLLNNVGAFSIWPLLKRDNLMVQYIFTVLLWNYSIGYNPLKLKSSFNKFLSLATYAGILSIHALELVAIPPPPLPDLFVVFNMTLSAGVFGLGFLWAFKRFVQEIWVINGPIAI